ncbi:hypothetical protein [Streptomyces sp. LN704]|uniref:hypothetical protein n=1 Tax=Streptomyces sp. LN704 TaxID=3112982 RepID=UPI00371E69CB
MPDPSTTRLSLYKSKSDGSELVSYTQDIGQNLDKLDAAAGFQACTSTTRPAAPYSGKPIFETNTSYRSYFSNGSSPASGSWVEIPNSSGVFGGNLALATGSSLSIGAATLTRLSGGGLNSNTNFQRNAAATTDVVISGLVGADAFDRTRIYADGKIEFGPGNVTRDVNLYRSGANTLATDDNLNVALNLTVGGVGQVQYILKTADETVTSSTTLQNDDHLVLPAVANAVYTFALDLYMVDTADATGDFKMSFTCPTGATFDMHGAGAHTTDLGASSTNSNGEWIGKLATTSAGATLGFGVSNPSATAARVYGRLVMGSTAGNLQLQWAQNASDASGTTLKAGSYMMMTRVA